MFIKCPSFICFNVHLLYIGGDMNINLGAPYEATIEGIIKRGYAGNQTEVIRQALLAYERMLEEEVVRLVNKAVELEMQEIHSGKQKTFTLKEIKEKYSL